MIEELREEEEDLGMRTPPRSEGRPTGRRRSKSTSELNTSFNGGNASNGKRKAKDGTLLDVPMDEEDPLSDSIDRELRKMGAAAGNVSCPFVLFNCLIGLGTDSGVCV